MNKWFTAQELVGLPGLPGTDRNIRALAAREGWEGQRRLGSKAIEYSFAVLPPEAQAALLARLVGQEDEPAPSAQLSAKTSQRDGLSASRLTDDQRAVMQARLAFVREIERMSEVVSQQRAIMTLVGLARGGQLSPYLAERVVRANDRKTPDRSLSERTLKRFLQNSPADLLARPDSGDSLTSQIRRLLGRDCRHWPDLEQIARQLHASPQTLRRRLREEGTSFQELKDQLRRDLAIYHLGRDALSIQAIAEQLGFSEASAFHRAFKKWTGLTPGAYRAHRAE